MDIEFGISGGWHL